MIGCLDTHHPGEEAAIRLAGGDGESNGRVEIFHAGEWGTVCDSNWGLEDAVVTCRLLGWPGTCHHDVMATFSTIRPAKVHYLDPLIVSRNKGRV